MSNNKYIKLKYKSSGDKRTKTRLFLVEKESEEFFLLRPVNKSGELSQLKEKKDGWHDEIHIISRGCVISITEVIEDFKYGELVVPEEASQNLPGWGIDQ